MTFVQVAERMT